MSSGRALRWPVVVEPRPAAPLWLKIVLPIASIGLALVVVAAFLAFRSFNPLEVYFEIVRTAFGSWFGFADTLTSATPLILTGLAVAFAFRVRLWNVGAEGQLIFGAIAATGFGVWIGDIMPAPIGIPMTLLAGMFGGVFWVALVAYGKARYGVNEILTSLMLNFVAVIFSYYLVDGTTSPWRDTTLPGHPVGREVASFLELPRVGTTRLHWGFFRSHPRGGRGVSRPAAHPARVHDAGYEQFHEGRPLFGNKHRRPDGAGAVDLGFAGRAGRRDRATGEGGTFQP